MKKAAMTEAQIAERKAKRAEYMRRWEASLTPEQKAERRAKQRRAYKAWYEREKVKNPEGMRELNRVKTTAYARANKGKIKSIYTRQRAKLKAEVFAHYGMFCACCGENEMDFLTIDHIRGDGAAHRKEASYGYAWLRKHNYPADFQTLCFNCNCAKKQYSECPHSRILKSRLTLVGPR